MKRSPRHQLLQLLMGGLLLLQACAPAANPPQEPPSPTQPSPSPQ